MKATTIHALLALLLIPASLPACAQETGAKSTAESVHSFTVKTIEAADKDLGEYKGHVLLLVNTASKCGYTPQYESLEKLYQEYKDKGLRILAFPANDFGAQEPGSDEQILEFCRTKYDVTFDLFSKISVKGPEIAPLYSFLTTASGYNGDIRWNFSKFLADREGKIVARFETKIDPYSDAVKQAVEKMLNASGE